MQIVISMGIQISKEKECGRLNILNRYAKDIKWDKIINIYI